MLKSTTKDFRKYFLLQFTKEMIKATDTYKTLSIKKQVKITLQNKENRPPVQLYRTPPRVPIRKVVNKMIRQKTHRDDRRVAQMKDEQPFENFFKPDAMRRGPSVLKIPELSLPQTVQYIRPVAGQKEIDLGKLNPLIRDPLVRTIECNGPDQKVVVTGAMGRKATPITLAKEDIDNVVSNFSEASRIPAQEGFYKVAVGRLIISAIISKIVGSKFIITKLRA